MCLRLLPIGPNNNIVDTESDLQLTSHKYQTLLPPTHPLSLRTRSYFRALSTAAINPFRTPTRTPPQEQLANDSNPTMVSKEWPQEIIDLIVDFFIQRYHVDVDCLAPLTLVSRKWNLAVGRRTRATCSVKNNFVQIDRFKNIYSSSRCRPYLHSLTFSSSRAICIPPTRDGSVYPTSFSIDISRAYFGTFSKLLAVINHLFDHEKHGDLELRVEPGIQSDFIEGHCNPNRLNVFFVPFETGMTLPTVATITDLVLSWNEHEGPAVHPELALLILRACPNIKTVVWRTGSPPLSKGAERQTHWKGKGLPLIRCHAPAQC